VEDGAIPSKTSATDDPFLGRINAKSVPPPHNVNSLKRCLAKSENISYTTRSSLFLTPYSQSPMDDAAKVTILNHTGPGSLPEEPLAFVAKLRDSERSALESVVGGILGSIRTTIRPSTTSAPNTRYRTPVYSTFLSVTSELLSEVYYLLYANDCEKASKAAFDTKEPSLGRIRADAITPPHTPSSILRHISRVEANPALASSHLFSDISCDTTLTKGHVAIIHPECPGLSPDKPMAIVQMNSRPLAILALQEIYNKLFGACTSLYQLVYQLVGWLYQLIRIWNLHLFVETGVIPVLLLFLLLYFIFTGSLHIAIKVPLFIYVYLLFVGKSIESLSRKR
jgi:hypothetical protein